MELPTVNLNERRAVFVYEAARLAAMVAGAPVIPKPLRERSLDFRLQFSDVIEAQCGEDRSHSAKALHEQWVKAYEAMGWTYGENYSPEARTHPDMVPYDLLGQLERDKDEVFMALCDIARKWIYDVEPGHPMNQY